MFESSHRLLNVDSDSSVVLSVYYHKKETVFLPATVMDRLST